MENMKKISILDTDNYNRMKQWLENPDAEEPEFAESFMTTMYLMYMNRKGSITERCRRRMTLKIEAIPSIKKLIENVEKKNGEVKQQVTTEQTQLPASADAITEEKPATDPQEPIKEETVFDQPEKTEEQMRLTAKDVGRAVRHCARLHGVTISDSHIQIILYVLYGYRLAKELPDVFAERPQMWKYGPVFASSYSSLKKTVDIEKDSRCWKAVNRYDIGLGTHMINLVSGLGERKVKELAAKHTAPGTPWHECRVMNPERWGVLMDEQSIKEWFKRKI